MSPASPVTFTIDFSALLPDLVQLALFGVSLLGAWLASTIRTKFHQAGAADLLDRVLGAGVDYARGKLIAAAGTTDLLKLNTHSQAVGTVAQFVIEAAPKAVKALGLTPDGVEKWALAKLTGLAPELVYVPGLVSADAPKAPDAAPALQPAG